MNTSLASDIARRASDTDVYDRRVGPIEPPELVRQRARSNGAAGRAWLDALPGMVTDLMDRWQIVLGPPMRGGTASFVALAVDRFGNECVLKVGMPLDFDGDDDSFRRTVLAHRLADGRGCARLIDHDTAMRAMLLERLGPNLAELGQPVRQVIDTVADTLLQFWRPVPDDVELPGGVEQATWLADFIVRTWDETGRPCERNVIDRSLDFCDKRVAAFDRSRAVLAHGDAHGWNTLSAGDGAFKLVDPEGLRTEREYDLAVPLREYNEPLLTGDTSRLVRERAERLASRCDADAEAIWQWGYIERVSTGLANLRDFDNDDGAAFLEVARRCLERC
jgi:streptomycin 6-kinase